MQHSQSGQSVATGDTLSDRTTGDALQMCARKVCAPGKAFATMGERVALPRRGSDRREATHVAWPCAVTSEQRSREMALMTWEPSEGLSTLQREVNRVFESFFDGPRCVLASR